MKYLGVNRFVRWKRAVGEANAVEKAQAAKRIEVQDEGIMAAKRDVQRREIEVDLVLRISEC